MSSFTNVVAQGLSWPVFPVISFGPLQDIQGEIKMILWNENRGAVTSVIKGKSHSIHNNVSCAGLSELNCYHLQDSSWAYSPKTITARLDDCWHSLLEEGSRESHRPLTWVFRHSTHQLCVFLLQWNMDLGSLEGARVYRYGQMRRGDLIYISRRESSSMLGADLSGDSFKVIHAPTCNLSSIAL